MMDSCFDIWTARQLVDMAQPINRESLLGRNMALATVPGISSGIELANGGKLYSPNAGETPKLIADPLDGEIWRFDGTDDVVVADKTPDFYSGADAKFTITFSASTFSGQPGPYGLGLIAGVYDDEGGSQRSLGLFAYNGILEVIIIDATGTIFNGWDTPSISGGEIVITFDNTIATAANRMKIYRNATELSLTFLNNGTISSIPTSTVPLTIGRQYVSPGSATANYRYSGDISRFLVHSGVMSLHEIQQLQNVQARNSYLQMTETANWLYGYPWTASATPTMFRRSLSGMNRIGSRSLIVC